MSSTILIVEDNPDVLEVLMEALIEEGGYTVHAARDLEAARRVIANLGQSLDLVLLDVQLPDGNGIDFCASLRRQGNSLPIIISSGYANEDHVERAFAIGASDYLVKPMYIRTLLAHVNLHLRPGWAMLQVSAVGHRSDHLGLPIHGEDVLGTPKFEQSHCVAHATLGYAE